MRGRLKIEVLILLGLTRTASEPKRDEPVELRQRDLQSQGEREREPYVSVSAYTPLFIDRNNVNTVNKSHNMLTTALLSLGIKILL